MGLKKAVPANAEMIHREAGDGIGVGVGADAFALDLVPVEIDGGIDAVGDFLLEVFALVVDGRKTAGLACCVDEIRGRDGGQ